MQRSLRIHDLIIENADRLHEIAPLYFDLIRGLRVETEVLDQPPSLFPATITDGDQRVDT